MPVSTQNLPPPPMPLNIPEPVSERDRERRGRPPSPLRNIYTVDPVTGEISEESSYHTADTVNEDRAWSQRSHSPSPSLTKFASNIAQRVGSLVGGISPQPPRSASGSTMLTDAELEAEAEREREWSRREAELIMQREAEERKMVENGVLALLNDVGKDATPLPPPPARTQTMSTPPSPASSQKEKEGGWFAAVKNKLTPSKEPLTPAQQVIQETKAKEKEKRKSKDKDWPAVPSGRDKDPAFLNLLASANKYSHWDDSADQRTPPRPISQYTTTMTPSPKRSIDSSADTPPLYAQFTAQGSLDVQGTLLTIARRFEKLERWSVSHVRALEERMGDVERWLVQKEEERGKKDDAPGSNSVHSNVNDDNDGSPHHDDSDLNEIRDELAELQGRVGELGREMAKLMTAPSKMASGPARQTAMFTSTPSMPPTPSSTLPRSLPTLPPMATTPQRTPSVQSRSKEVTSPTSLPSAASRTRLPYPTGDYASPPNSALSPASSPPPSTGTTKQQRPMSIAGLPSSSGSFTSQLSSSNSNSTSGLPLKSMSPVERQSSSSLPPPAPLAVRQTSMSPTPTPRKRYTVALGGPITAPGDDDEEHRPQHSRYTASPATTPDVLSSDNSDTEDSENEGRRIGHTRDDTIGKSETRRGSAPSTPNDSLRRTPGVVPRRSSPGTPRARAQSSYGPISGSASMSMSSLSTSPSTVAPLRPRLRSQSTDRIGLGISGSGFGSPTKFVDPLVVRKQEREASAPKTPKTPLFSRSQKVPVGQLVAYFDDRR